MTPPTHATSINQHGLAPPASNLVGDSQPMIRLKRLISAVACRDCTVLLQGNSGTGKELIARSLHNLSKRADGPFVPVDCTGLRDTLLESQLFGHVKGAFTGADQPTMGFFRAADGGTLFLDEIGEMDIKTQAKLLRCIQERSVVPLGAVKGIPIDVRVIAATHRDLKAMIARGDFREDLYFRLDVVKLEIPTLDKRPGDVRLLTDHFLTQLSNLYDEPPKRLSPEARALLEGYSWPGNVRELANAIEHAVVFAADNLLTPGDFPERLSAGTVTSTETSEGPIVTLESAEKTLIARALRATSGNQSKAASILNIERRRLARKIERYGLRALVDGEIEGE